MGWWLFLSRRDHMYRVGQAFPVTSVVSFPGTARIPSNEMTKEMDAYKAYVKQCGKTPKNIGECTGMGLFSRSTPAADKLKGCKICTDGPYKGGFVKDDADCLTTNVQYRNFAVDEESEGAKKCTDSEGMRCFKKEEYEGTFPDDCDDVGYQNIKRRVSGLLVTICDELNKVVPPARKNTEDQTFSVAQQCSATAPDFMQCGDNEKCWYIPAGCTYKGEGTRPVKLTAASQLDDFDCSGVGKKELAACRNDFSECTDPFYLEDSGYDEGAAELCKKAHDQWKGLNMTLLWVTIASYILLLILGIALTIIGSNRDKKAFEARGGGGFGSIMQAGKQAASGGGGGSAKVKPI